MHKWTTVVIVVLSLSACKDEKLTENSCNVANPVTDIDWISTRIQEMEQNSSDMLQYFYLMQANLNGSTVFIFNNCCPFCSSAPFIQDCTGQILGTLGYDYELNEFTQITIIWAPLNFACHN